MRSGCIVVIFCLFLVACRTVTPPIVEHVQHLPEAEKTIRAQSMEFVNLAANLGLRHSKDLRNLFDALISAGVGCEITAMSLNTEQIVVGQADFECAKMLATWIIKRNRLTVRLYSSADFIQHPATSYLEVWLEGQKVRTEKFNLY